MTIEIEKKYRLGEADRERITRELSGLGAEFVGREFEENSIYGGAALGDQAAIIRIRKVGERTLLTYKRRVESEFAVKKQIEHEIQVSDPEATESILHELGLKRRLVYEKYRDTWNLRAVEVVLDELPFGLFMEIEGSITGIKEAEILLAIEDLDTEHETYPLLTARLGKQVGETTEARFTR